MAKITKKLMSIFIVAAIVLGLINAYVPTANAQETGMWVTGDFHNHTFLTDGSYKEMDVLQHAFDQYGLDWFANSEHGGKFSRDENGQTIPAEWRWVSLKDRSYPIISVARSVYYPNKLIIQGLEWNVPTHEHASVGIVTNEPTSISDFEYMFDQKDTDTSRSVYGMEKHNVTHLDAVAAVKWLEDNYKDSSYFIINHPSRALKYTIADIRDFNNAAPDVAIGMEGFPGHQRASNRGEYGSTDPRATTYGGADYMIAKVGGLWDALLGEGRHFWIFVNSDFHSISSDFWPGEYSKTYTYIQNKDYKSLIAGLRSGNSFIVNGDLINALDFKASNGSEYAGMGQTLQVNKGGNVEVTIRFKSPEKNNNGDPVSVDHVDLIAGDVTGKVEPGTADYNKDTNSTTKVIARFDKSQWTKDAEGYNVIKYTLNNVNNSKYLRLRGTNLGLNVPNETDADGNPLDDKLLGANDATKAYKDLWFYSNPVFVNVNDQSNNTPSMTINGPDKVNKGDEFTVSVGIKDVTKTVYAQDITINYDQNMFEFNSLDQTNSNLAYIPDTKPGVVRVLLASKGPQNAINSDTQLFNLKFTAKTLGSGNITISDVTLADGDGHEFPAQTAFKGITVSGNTYDLNSDGSISVGDLGIVAKYYGLNDKSPSWNEAKIADVNNDNSVGLEDLIIIANKILEKK
jgi:Cohesin domain.